jgi:hypothetical protein
MNDSPPSEQAIDDQPASRALSEADPADAPDIADGITAALQRELDETGAPDQTQQDPDPGS